MKSKTTGTVILVVALVATLAVPAVVPAAPTVVEGVRVAVWTLPDKNEIASLIPGESVDLEVGDSVMLRVFSPADKNPTGQRLYLSAKFEVEQGGGRIALTDANTDKGAVVVRARRDRGKATLRYELLGNVKAQRDYQNRGLVEIQIVAAKSAESGLTWPEEQVDMLYRAILMRELDRDAAAGWVDRVDDQGYLGVLSAAKEIAESRESHNLTHDRGVSSHDRLAAVFEHFLGLHKRDVTESEWHRQLDRLDHGDVAGVVLDVLRSPEFRQRHGFEEIRWQQF